LFAPSLRATLSCPVLSEKGFVPFIVSDSRATGISLKLRKVQGVLF
jgi:hypothetical protein